MGCRGVPGQGIRRCNLGSAQLPIDARAIHTIDLDDWDYDAHSPALQQVCRSIAALLSGAPPGAGAPSAPEPRLAEKPSLAVMPFVNLSGDPQQDYFADGMMEEIVTSLSRVRSIFVVASGSTLCFRGKAVSAQAVGRQLGVRYLLEGSVRRSGDRVRIAPKLVDPSVASTSFGAADGVVPNDNNGVADVFTTRVCHDTTTCVTTTTRVSVGDKGLEGNGASFMPPYQSAGKIAVAQAQQLVDLSHRVLRLRDRYFTG